MLREVGHHAWVRYADLRKGDVVVPPDQHLSPWLVVDVTASKVSYSQGKVIHCLNLTDARVTEIEAFDFAFSWAVLVLRGGENVNR